jgi:hypothetical protein
MAHLMLSQADHNPPGLSAVRRLSRVWPYLFLAGLTWVAHFWLSSSFGLYEDDYTLIPAAIEATPEGLARSAATYFLELRGHGRTIQGVGTMFLSRLGWSLGGLQAIYVLGFTMVAANGLLSYGLLRRLTGPLPAFFGGLAFTLYPSDTTHAFLTHSLGLQPSITFFLLGAHAYLSGKRWAPFAAGILILATYETVYPLLLAVPLLQQPWRRGTLRGLARNGLGLLGLFAVVAVVRSLLGDSRVANLDLGQAILTAAGHSLVGPWVGFGGYFYKGVKLAATLSPGVLAAIVAGAGVVGWTLARLYPAAMPTQLPNTLSDLALALRSFVRPSAKRADGRYLQMVGPIRLTLLGLILLVLAYPLTLTTNPIALVSRGTRVHFAGVIGAGLLWAGVAAITLKLATRRVGVFMVLSSILVVLGLSLAYAVTVQQDYARAWQLQRTFWRDVLGAAADLEEGTVVLVGGEGIEDSLQIGANTWAVPMVMPQIAHFPDDWSQPPLVFRLHADWRSTLWQGGDVLTLSGQSVLGPPAMFSVVDPDDVIVVRINADGSTDRLEELAIGSQVFGLQAQGSPALPALEKSALWHLLLDSPTDLE